MESDEPQVAVNQRYEVYFPEKRPFFTDRAGFFQTPERVFFSRRIVDPVVGLRLTGVAGGWTVGSLVVEDAASATMGDRGRAVSAIARAQRAFHGDSYWGATASVVETQTGATNRLLSFDTRAKLNANWIVTAQAIKSETSDDEGARSGLALFGEIRHSGRHLNYYSNYRDRTPEFAAPLGFITRVDMRQMKHVIGYRWKPTHGPLVGVGPSVFTLANWDHAGILQEASVDVPLWLDFKGPASIAVGRTRGMERYRAANFERDATYAYASTDALGWLSIDGSISRGSGINYYPSTGIPAAGGELDATAGLTVRPSARIQIANAFVFSRLSASGQTVYADRYVRVKASLQVTREWSVRAISEMHRLDVGRLYAGTPDRRMTFDFLTTYLVHPGSALYLGFTDRVEDLAFESPASLISRTTPPSALSRQFFVKATRTLTF